MTEIDEREGTSPRPPRAIRDPLWRRVADTTKRRRPVRGGPSSPARQPRPPGARTRERRRVMAREGSEARTPAAEVDLGRLAEISGGDTEFEQQLAGEYVNQAAD